MVAHGNCTKREYVITVIYRVGCLPRRMKVEGMLNVYVLYSVGGRPLKFKLSVRECCIQLHVVGRNCAQKKIGICTCK